MRAAQNKKPRTSWIPFEEARKYVHGLLLYNREAWSEYCKSGKKPDNIPAGPGREYKDKGWKNWGDWLGTYTIAIFNREYSPFAEARKHVHGLKLNNKPFWIWNRRNDSWQKNNNDKIITASVCSAWDTFLEIAYL